MKGIVLVCSLCLNAILAFAQVDSVTNDILTTKRFRVGLFIKFSSFKANTPEITTGYTITEDTVRGWHRVVFDKGLKRRDVYAFSDGKFLYINAKVYSEHANYFVKILLLGPIIYFEDDVGKSTVIRNRMASSAAWYGGVLASVIIQSIKSIHGTNPGWIMYLPDEDGEAYILDAKNLLSIFKAAKSGLYAKLNGDSTKTHFETQLDYLQQFNEQASSLNPK